MSRTTIHTRALAYVPVIDDVEDVVDEEDNAALSVTRESLVVQQYVVYSATFQVPAFYLTVHDSQGSPLSLAELVRTSVFRPFAFDGTESTTFAVSLPTSAFPLLSQGEHPTLGLPCWYFHPCETAQAVDEVMREVRDNRWSEEEELVRWLEVWFMVVGGVVDLRR